MFSSFVSSQECIRIVNLFATILNRESWILSRQVIASDSEVPQGTGLRRPAKGGTLRNGGHYCVSPDST